MTFLIIYDIVNERVKYAALAQSVERRLGKAEVGGSSPLGSFSIYNGTHIVEWGISAVGSAPHWQCGGHGFKSRMLHLLSSGRREVLSGYFYA